MNIEKLTDMYIASEIFDGYPGMDAEAYTDKPGERWTVRSIARVADELGLTPGEVLAAEKSAMKKLRRLCEGWL